MHLTFSLRIFLRSFRAAYTNIFFLVFSYEPSFSIVILEHHSVWPFAGYTEINQARKQGYEEGFWCWSFNYYLVLCSLWLHWLCRFRKQCSWEFSYWVRFFWTLLVNWLCQYLHCHPSHRSLSGQTSTVIFFATSIVLAAIDQDHCSAY